MRTESRERYYVAAAEVLGAATNGESLSWSWGTVMPEMSRGDWSRCRVRCQVNVVPDDDFILSEALSGRYHYFRGERSKEIVEYDRPLIGRRRLRLRASNLGGDSPELTFNRTYARYVRHRVMNLHSLGYIATDVAAASLLRSGYAPVHCSAISIAEGEVILILAAPNTGKTLSAMRACVEFGAGYLAEDLAITDGVNLYGVPWTSTFRYYTGVDRSVRSKVLKRLTTQVPAVELLGLGRRDRIDAFIPADRIVRSGRVSHVIVLERGEDSVEEVGSAEMFTVARNLNDYEFRYKVSPLLLAYEFFKPSFDLPAQVMAEGAMLKGVIEQAARRVVIRRADPADFAPFIVDWVRGHG
jgi:hypothetical protein